ncbi:MAG: lysophospholipid acyltransferase family protein [Planctomycetota bacterium]|nr:MAG: lysophospholipid acyltransferase family protein [Planctomycetota bacterium]
MAKQNTTIHWLTYVVIRLIAMIMQMFPINMNLKTARLMGWIWYKTIRRHRQRAGNHLRLAFGSSLPQHRIEQMTLQSMQQMTMMAVEVLFTPRLINEWTWPRYVKLNNINEALDTLLNKRGAIMVTGHYGNWELLGFMLTAIGFPIVAVMRPLDNSYLNRYLMEARAKRGLKLLYKKGVAQSAEDVLRNGGILCFIADQNAGRKGEFVEFFGQKASTYKSIALLAIEHQVPIIVGYARRLSEKFEYELGCNRLIKPSEWKRRKNELHWLTQEYTRAIEMFVRQAPQQYLWIHRRWKSQPRRENLSPPSPAHEINSEQPAKT